jgi:hemerythrin
MIKWNSNFNIPDSTVQLAEAFIKVVDYKNINNHSTVHVSITDEIGDVMIKEYTKEFDRTFENVDEIYEELLLDYEDAEIIS